MATSLSTKIDVSLKATLTNALDNVTVSAPLSVSAPYSWSNGTVIDTADRIYQARLTLSTTPTDVDLAGALTDSFGNVITFTKVNAIYVKNRSEVVGEIVKVGGDAAPVSAPFGDASDIVKVYPGGLFLLVNPSLAGYGVTGTTFDILQLVAMAGAPVVDLIVIGRSA